VAATAVLARLEQPFTAAQARQALDTTRRTAIPLLEYLDSAGVTERLADDRRVVRDGPVPSPSPVPSASPVPVRAPKPSPPPAESLVAGDPSVRRSG
jgi:hypothetical protein